MSNNILIDGELYDSETGELINEVEQIEVEVIENTLPDIICNGGTHIRTNTIQLKQELAKYLGIGLSTVWLYAKQGKITPKKASDRVTLFEVAEVEKALLGA